jgi:GWxTD domain-containing protein
MTRILTRRRLTVLIVVLLVYSVSQFATGQSPKRNTKSKNRILHLDGGPNRFKTWLEQDVAWIITPAEKTVFNRLQNDEQRDKFIEAFWLCRDPTPDTYENEFKEEHYRRIAYANDHFAAQEPGWKTDRGRIYIVYDPPDHVSAYSVHDSRPQATSGMYSNASRSSSGIFIR